ncbi:MAG: ribosome-associated translation inhibitor RaiA [bacterium]|jgi:putative sigma-54 modulation protein|nr:ribosome-associated translation inhibitor RaiA [bacterium]
MQFVISGKHLRLTNSLKKYAESKLARISKYFDHIIEMDVVLSVAANRDRDSRKVAETTVWANGIVFRGHAVHEDMYAAIDELSEKIEKQVRRYKEKKRNRGRRRGESNEAIPDMGGRHTVVSTEKGKPSIVRTRGFIMKPMFVDDAAMELESLKQDFLVFSNAETKNVNVMYKRADGNYGLIEPEF